MHPPPDDQPSERGTITTTIEGSASSEVIRAVSIRANEAPEALPPLNDVIDPDALNAVFGPKPDGTPRCGGVLVFPYAGHRVWITDNREVAVTPLSERD